jgi:site-specific recombinase XerD
MPSFEDAWTAYEADLRRRRCRESSVEQYWQRIKKFRNWTWEELGVDWADAGPDELEAFYERGCKPGAVHSGQPLSPATKAVYGISIKVFYNACYRLDVLPYNNFRNYVPPAPPDPRPRPLTRKQMARLLRHVHDHPDSRLEPLVGSAYYAGLRMGETTTLTVDGINLEAEQPYFEVLGKGHDEVVLMAVNSKLAPILRRHTYWLAGQAGVSSPRDLPAGTPLIQSLTRPGHGVGRSLPSRLVHQAMAEAGVDGRPHDLRRTYAHHIGVGTGHNLEAIRCGLRHRGYSALKFYLEPTLGQVGAWVEQVPDPLEEEG